MPAGRRMLLALLAVVPLLAPYELILRIEWTDYANPFFLFAAAVSAGAVAVSAFLVFAAVAGLSSRMMLDAPGAVFTYSAVAPAVRGHARTYPLSSIARVTVRTHEWSEGSPSYSLRVTMSDGAVFGTASSWSREEIERCRTRIEEFLISHGVHPADAPAGAST